MSVATSYRHTQKAPLYLLLAPFALLFFVLGWVLRDIPPVSVIMPIAGSLMLILSLSFRHLTVADEGDRLAIQFGPLPLFRKMIRYEDIRQVEVGRTTLLDGWGIHMSLQGGWVWNIWGRDCVVVHHQGITRIGTDEAENLAQFLKTKIVDRS
jgi:hypothetical protein